MERYGRARAKDPVYHGYAHARFREQTSSDVSLLVCSRKRAQA